MTQRALVLSGGGPTGIAWQTGLATGLREAVNAGLDQAGRIAEAIRGFWTAT